MGTKRAGGGGQETRYHCNYPATATPAGLPLDSVRILYLLIHNHYFFSIDLLNAKYIMLMDRNAII